MCELREWRRGASGTDYGGDVTPYTHMYRGKAEGVEVKGSRQWRCWRRLWWCWRCALFLQQAHIWCKVLASKGEDADQHLISTPASSTHHIYSSSVAGWLDDLTRKGMRGSPCIICPPIHKWGSVLYHIQFGISIPTNKN